MEPVLLVTILTGILGVKIVAEIIAQPLADNIATMHQNWFWTLDPTQASDRELLAVVNAVLPPVEVLQELCAVPLPY